MAIKIPEVTTLDFETKGIKRRPEYPPVPVGLSILEPGMKKAEYLCWGHPEGNNTTKEKVAQRLKGYARDGRQMLFHNGKFDYDVAMTHLAMPEVAWDRIHDTMYLLFLNNPHAFSLALKPSAEEILGLAPEERDIAKDWVLAHKREIEAKYGEKFTPKEWGAYICELPGAIAGPYANGDVVRTLKLFRKLYPVIHTDGMLKAYDRERRLMPILLRNEGQGIRVAHKQLEADLTMYEKATVKIEAWMRKRLKVPTLNFDADADVANALNDAGIVTEWVATKTGKRSTSKKNMTLDMFTDKRVAAALGYRNRLQTCMGTFMRPWLLTAQQSNGWIYTNWNQVRNSDSGKGTRTGRLSSNPNFQNIPKAWYDKGDGYTHPKFIDVPELPLMRNYVLPDERGGRILHRDYSQQELRIAAHFENGKLMKEFLKDDDLDVHTFVKNEITRITGTTFERRAVKIINFGMLYGMGLENLALGIDCPVDEAKQLRAAHKLALPDVINMDKAIKLAAKQDNEPIRTWGGRLYYCEDPVIIDGRTMSFEYKLLNYMIQGSAADCTKEAIINYDQIKKNGRFMLTVHDENNVSVHAKAAKSEMKLLKQAMESVAFDVPMKSDGKFGTTWGNMKKE